MAGSTSATSGGGQTPATTFWVVRMAGKDDARRIRPRVDGCRWFGSGDGTSPLEAECDWEGFRFP
jgi:hypothetical protein